MHGLSGFATMRSISLRFTYLLSYIRWRNTYVLRVVSGLAWIIYRGTKVYASNILLSCTPSVAVYRAAHTNCCSALSDRRMYGRAGPVGPSRSSSDHSIVARLHLAREMTLDILYVDPISRTDRSTVVS